MDRVRLELKCICIYYVRVYFSCKHPVVCITHDNVDL